MNIVARWTTVKLALGEQLFRVDGLLRQAIQEIKDECGQTVYPVDVARALRADLDHNGEVEVKFVNGRYYAGLGAAGRYEGRNPPDEVRRLAVARHYPGTLSHAQALLDFFSGLTPEAIRHAAEGVLVKESVAA